MMENWAPAQETLKSFASIAVVFIIIYILWYILWKLAFEPNPLVRDFFDLDSNKKALKKKTKYGRP